MNILPSEIKKIIVFRALQIGDMLCSIPAIKALRATYPAAEISLLGLPWAKSLVDRFDHYFDRFIHFPGFPGLPEQEFVPAQFSEFLSMMIDEKFELFLQMQGNGTIVNPMLELFGAKHTAGFFKEGVYAPQNGHFMIYPQDCHEIDRHLKLMEFLGIPPLGRDLEFPLKEKDYVDFKHSDLGLERRKYVCIHPGSRGISRRWNPEYFAQLGDMAAQKGLTPVITGTKEELDIANELASKMTHIPLIAAGKTSMGAVAVLLQESAGLVSNCTGVSHIAAALKTPSVVISLDCEPQRWLPLNKSLHRSVDWNAQPDFETVRSKMEEMLNSA